MRIAVNSRKKDQSGEWTDVANYFNVVAFGKQAENCAEYLSKGRPIAVQGRLEWREWETDDGQRREQVSVVADAIQFLAAKSDTPNQDKTEDAIPF
jgi:single-strand DNA-binding protein